jgi:hypothetical protein
VAATLVQTASNFVTASTSVTIGSGNGWATPTAGNLIALWAVSDAGITPPAGYTNGPSVVDSNAAYLWWKVAAGTETTAAFTVGASTSPTVVGAMEYSGVSATPTDVQNSSSIVTTSGTTTTATSVTATGTSGDLFIAVAGLGFPGATFPTTPVWANSFVNRQTLSAGTAGASTAQLAFVADYQNTAAATVSTSCSWTNAAANRQGLILALKLSAGAPPEIPMLVMPRSA